MPAPVPLPCPLEGELEFQSRNLPNPIPEPRIPQKSSSETIRSHPNGSKNQNNVYFCSSLDRIAKKTEGLVYRLRSLKHKIALLRSNPDRILEGIYKKPPDPDPAVSNVLNNCVVTVVIDALHEREEYLATMSKERLELQVITGCNSEYEGASYTIQEGIINWAEYTTQVHPPVAHQANRHLTVHSRYSPFCPMATNGDKAELSGAVVKHSHLGDSEVSQAEGAKLIAGKELAESSKHGEKGVLVVNMSGARATLRPRFLGVGLFLSVLLVNSRQLIDHMKRVWKIRGELEDSPIECETGRKFILDFSEEGDWRHAILGGPWQYKGDAFLVEGLATGADPSLALFTHVPMWVQFRNIPFYLLTKKLAYDLGECIGTTMKIDQNARGNIDEKFLRTRVQLPLYKALQQEIRLVDEITDEEVVVQIRYERLPNFCLFCGFIGHMEARCDMPLQGRKINFSLDLRVRPIHFEDPRCWFLPSKMGMAQRHHSTQLWRAPIPADHDQCKNNSVIGAVELVQEKVAKLSVSVNGKNSVTIGNDTIVGGGSAGDEKGTTQNTEQVLEATKTPEDTSHVNKKRTWKRKECVDLNGKSKESNSNNLVPPPGYGTVRAHEAIQDEDMVFEPAAKRSTFQGSTKIEYHSKVAVGEKEDEDQSVIETGQKNSGKDVMGGKEAEAATGLGATGNLSGANDCARQEP